MNKMKEKIYNYLEAKNSSASTQELIRHFFHVHGSYPAQLEAIVSSLLQDDPRFIRDAQGHWRIQPQPDKSDLSEITFSIFDIESLPVGRGQEVLVGMGIAQLKHEHVVSHKIFKIPFREQYADPLKRALAALRASFASAPRLDQHIETVFRDLQNTILVSDSPGRKLAMLNAWFLKFLPTELELDRLSLVNLARLLLPDNKIRSLADIAAALSMAHSEPLDLKARLDLMSEITVHLIHQLRSHAVRSWTDLKQFMDRTKIWVDFSRYRFDQDFIKQLPERPGVYLMRDNFGNIFYVGKAKNLKSRVESYFVNRFDLDEKGRTILDRIADLSYEVVGSELEALLVENQYIHQFHPELNTQIKIHPLDLSRYKKRQLILFLPGKADHEIVLFFIDGFVNMTRTVINKSQPDWQSLKQEMQEFFFDPAKQRGIYSNDQIEIFWRWFAMNQDKINFIDMADCGGLDSCLELLKQYGADDQLFLDKIYHR